MRDILRGIPLFKDLADEDLDSIAALLKPVDYTKNQIIFHQGDIGDAMYLVESGQVLVWDENTQHALAYLGPGSFVGEIALLLAKPRSATLKVTLDAHLHSLSKQDFDQLLIDRPSVAVYMTRELSQRLVDSNRPRQQLQHRISALWGIDPGELTRTLSKYLRKPLAILPLPGSLPAAKLRDFSNTVFLDEDDITVDNLAEYLSLKVEEYGHIMMLLPTRVGILTTKAIKLADVIISIGGTPTWIEQNAGEDKIWDTTSNSVKLNRIARRLTGHTIGLALSSGGGKGLAHIGVMKVLQEENIPIDILAGTSAGAFFGIFYAAGWDSQRFNQFADEIQTLNRWVNWDINIPPKAGILKGIKARKLIADLVEHKRFEDLEIPFYCVAADILTGEAIVFHSGDLANAIRASLSIPILADPWYMNNRYLIDGAFVDPIPANLLRNKGADIVIASSVIQPLLEHRSNVNPPPNRKMPHFLKIITNIQNMVEDQLVKFQLDAIDVMIHTKVRVDHALDFENAHSIIAAGEASARAQLPAIKACLEAYHD